MDRSPSPTTPVISPEHGTTLSALPSPRTIAYTPDVTPHGLETPASSTFSPSAGFLRDFSGDDRDGVYSGAASRLDMDMDDGRSLLGRNSMHNRRHSRHYDRMDSLKDLAKVGFIKLVVTVFFGIALCVCLKAWEGFHSPVALTIQDVRIFNALTIGLSLCIGLNLLSSLRRYALVLRWAILTKRYVSMEAFDLILGIDELTNVIKLMALSLPGLRNRRWLAGKTRNWVHVNPGTNHWYVYACALWLLINIGSQVLVASLSLFWPMQPFECELTKHGTVAVADLSSWVNKSESAAPREAAWRYGMDAQSWQTFPADESHKDLSKLAGTPIYKAYDNASYEYRFFYRNPEQPYSEFEQSDRCIQTRTLCDPYDVRGDIKTSSNITGFPKRYIEAKRRESETWVPVPIPVNGYGMVSYISIEKACGDNNQCTAVDVLQYRDEEGEVNSTIKESRVWRCKNSVSSIRGCKTKGVNHTGIDLNDHSIFSNDEFARVAAGAIGWTGITMNGWEDRQYHVYPQGTPWSPNRTISTAEVQDTIMRYTIGAIAAFDDHGIRHNIFINQNPCKRDSQRLNVSWRNVGGILAAIGFIQLSALLFLLIRANRTIVRDASSFSTAVLLRSVLEAIGHEPGVLALTGEQIKDHPKLRYRKIKYGYVETRDGARQIKVSFEGEGKDHRTGRWPSGEYR